MPNIHQEQTETLWILNYDFALHNIRNNIARFVVSPICQDSDYSMFN